MIRKTPCCPPCRRGPSSATPRSALSSAVPPPSKARADARQGSAESLVRNVDGVIFGEHRARSLIDLPASLSARGGDELKKILAAITAKEVNAFYVHLAEGQRDNQRSIDEFAHLVSLNALTDSTIIIHGTAMTRDQLAGAADQGAKLAWSPQSNLRLYGQTTRVGDALDVGLPVALGADWLPSGSTSLLAEMKVVRQELTNQNHPISAKKLTAMVTSTAADIAGLGDKTGTLEVGRPPMSSSSPNVTTTHTSPSAPPTPTTSSSCSSAETSPTDARTGSPLSPRTRQTSGWNQS